MNDVTVLNVTARNGKMMFTYFCSMLLTSACGFVLILKYRQKYESWKTKLDPSVDFQNDTDIAHYTIMVENLPQNLSVDDLQQQIDEAIPILLPGIGGKSPFIKSRVCGDYEKLYKMCVNLKYTVEELKKVRKQNQRNIEEGEGLRV